APRRCRRLREVDLRALLPRLRPPVRRRRLRGGRAPTRTTDPQPVLLGEGRTGSCLAPAAPTVPELRGRRRARGEVGLLRRGAFPRADVPGLSAPGDRGAPRARRRAAGAPAGAGTGVGRPRS